ncbi:MAG: SH3 domain-containing protein [Lachnospiraceae bacterium]|nr:SH3 domain-containing protein [Lachnospiraceae bacterium]
MKKQNETWNNIMIFIMDHKKRIMPAVLLVCVALTVFFAMQANKRAGTATASLNEGATGYEVPVTEVAQNAYPEVNELIRTYYEAWAKGDTEAIDKVYRTLDETERLKTVELANYIEDIPEINVFTKPGPVEGSYVVYASITVKFHDYAESVPGVHALYVCTDEDGTLYINSENSDDHIKEYIREISLQNDVIDLYNTVSARYNEMKAQDAALDTFLSSMLGNVNITVGEALATNMAAKDVAAAQEAGTAETASEETPLEEAGSGASTGTQVATRNIIRATDVVNIRTSDSETADKIAKTAMGDEYTQLEARANGWSKILYEGREAFVKTEFFEVVGTEEVPGGTEIAAANASTAASTASSAASTASSASSSASSRASTASSSASSTGAGTASSASSASSSASTRTSAASASSAGAASAASTGASTTAGGITGPGDYHVKETTRVRKSASTESDIVAVAYQKNPIEVVNVQADGWCKVKYDGKDGFVKAEYLTE